MTRWGVTRILATKEGDQREAIEHSDGHEKPKVTILWPYKQDADRETHKHDHEFHTEKRDDDAMSGNRRHRNGPSQRHRVTYRKNVGIL